MLQNFQQLAHLPLVVDLTVEENARLKVLYGSREGFHAIDLDSGSIDDIYIPTNVFFKIESRKFFLLA